MSSEYSIVVKLHKEYELFWERISKIKLVVEFERDYILIKDLKIRSSWKYDVRIFRQEPPIFWLEVTNWSLDIYRNLLICLENINYNIYDDGDEQLGVSIENVFRIK